MNNLVIGICGGTGSGKTTLANRIYEAVGEDAVLIGMDAYYKNNPHLTFEERCKINYDHPDAFDTELMLRDLRALKNGQAVDCPTYDYSTHLRAKRTIHLEPKHIIIMEGILLFANPEIVRELDIKLFVDTDADVRILRRILRDVNERALAALGPNTGYDAIAQTASGGNLAALLSALDRSGELPKTVLFSLNPADNAQIGTILGAFQSEEIPGKIQQGPAWWFNDTKSGIEEQLRSLASQSLLGNFIGMLTDSRSYLSYTRHEYFRRIFCNMIGTWVENGEYPADEEALRRIVEGVSYRNAKRYFEL